MNRFNFVSWTLIGVMALFFSSCEKAPFVTLTGPRSFSFNMEGGSQTFALSCNRDWVISSSESWVKVSPSSGNAVDGNITVTISCSPNETYDMRTASITVKVEELEEKISVTQESSLGLIVSPTVFNLTNAAQTIEIEVKDNVSYSVVIPDDAKNWISIISNTQTKALSNDKIILSIEQNTTYEDRESIVRISQIDGILEQTICVKQEKMAFLTADISSYESIWQGSDFAVMIRGNVDYTVSLPEWIVEKSKQSQKDGAVTIDALVLSVMENLGKERSDNVTLKWYSSGEEETCSIIISQGCPSIVVETPGSLEGLLPINKAALSCLVVSGDLGAIDYLALSDCPSLSTIDLSGVSNTTMPASAFANNAIIETVLLPKNLCAIPAKLFENSGISSIVFPSCIEVIHDKAFANCKRLSGELVFPSSLKEIGNYVFSGCTNLTCGITIPDSVVSIGDSAFSTDMSNTYDQPHFRGPLVLGKSLKYIGDSAFAWYEYSGELTIPESLTQIGACDSPGHEAVFFGSHFTSIKFHDNVEVIGDCVFQYCKFLERIVLPKNLKELGHQAFYECTSATGSIIIPDSVDYMGAQPFGECNSLDGYVLMNETISFYDGTFRDCTKLYTYYCKRKTAPMANDWTFRNCSQKYLGVPIGSKESYESAPYWKDFMVIEEIDFDSAEL